MTDTSHDDTHEAREAAAVGEKPDLGHTPDALVDALSGTDSGSDTRAGSLRGGSSSGSSDDPDQTAINEMLATEGMASADPQSPSGVEPNPVKNTGKDLKGAGGDPAEGKRGEADAATG